MKKIIITTLAIALAIPSCDTVQVLQTANQVGSALLSPTNDEAISGLKEALKLGVGSGTDFLGKTDAFWGNAALKILLPPEAQKMEKTLRDMGMGSSVDKCIKALNSGAENAMKEAKPIFSDAITGMSFNDAMKILTGGNGAATTYLKNTTSTALHNAFKPVIQNSLNTVGATKYWTDIANIYNKIPTVQKVNPDLNDYVTTKATGALFNKIEEEENAIRTNPAKRVTAILKKTFDYAASQQGK